MNERICLFAGTTEGRRLAGILKDAVDLTVCVATEYGEITLGNTEGMTVHTGRMDEAEMTAFFAENRFVRVIDATHPYAQIVTQNIAAAAEKASIPVMRILREADGQAEHAVYVNTAEEARDYLSAHEGTIFITTGAKELSAYAGLDMSRVWARVLPVASSLEACEQAGIPTAHIIAAQGPFPKDVNLAQLRMIGADYLVTKSSGKSGGFAEKIEAAREAGAVAVIIGQPPQGSGLTLEEAVAELGKQYALPQRKLFLVGVGPGNRALLTKEASDALNECDAVIGAGSVIAALQLHKPTFAEFLPDGVQKILEEHPEIRRAAIVMRGDVGFYSGAKKLLERFRDADVTVIPGLSSVVVFAAKLGVGWDDAALVSLHGREENLIHTVGANQRTFALTGGENPVGAVCRKLCDYGFGSLRVTVGERLTYPEERITTGSAESLSDRSFDPLSVVCIENPGAMRAIRQGIADEDFLRGDVPMTKSEVRAISLSKLELPSDAIVWDVGAGTGSVSVECALAAYDGHVYAVEKEADAAELIRRNKRKFRADNLEIVEGTAPDALAALPAPTHAFIGGSSGNLREILAALLEKNPAVRIVLNTVTVESQSEAVACAKEYGFETFEAVTVNVARSKQAGRYHLMTAQNPVTVFVLQGGKRP